MLALRDLGLPPINPHSPPLPRSSAYRFLAPQLPPARLVLTHDALQKKKASISADYMSLGWHGFVNCCIQHCRARAAPLGRRFPSRSVRILSNKKYERWARRQGSSEAPTVTIKPTFPDEMWLHIPEIQLKASIDLVAYQVDY